MTDVSKFQPLNVADTCSLWNVLASRLLFASATEAAVKICSTNFILYECLHKPGQPRPERVELQARLRQKIANGAIASHAIDVEDLQDVEVLRNRKRISIGELSAIVFARKTQQAVLTDDLKAHKLALSELGANMAQSTPHLFAWLYFNGRLNDADKDTVLSELRALNRNIQPHLDSLHAEAQRCRLMTVPVVGADPGSK